MRVEHRLGGRVGQLVDDLRRRRGRRPGRRRGGVRVVGDHDDGLAEARGPSRAGSRAPRRRSGSRGCRSARRRR